MSSTHGTDLPRTIEISFDPIVDWLPRRPGVRIAEDGSLITQAPEVDKEVMRFLRGPGKNIY